MSNKNANKSVDTLLYHVLFQVTSGARPLTAVSRPTGTVTAPTTAGTGQTNPPRSAVSNKIQNDVTAWPAS